MTRKRVFLRVQVLKLLQEGNVLYGGGKYTEAAAKFQIARDQAVALQEFDLASRAMGNLGGCQFAFSQFRQALQSFTEAHRLAETAGDHSAAAGLEANIATLYSQLGETDAAVQWKERALAGLTGKDREQHLARVQIELASLRARQGRTNDAFELFRMGIEEALRRGNRSMEVAGWNRLGEELLRQNEPDRAREAFLESYRIRRLNGLPLDISFCELGRLRLVEGDYQGASELLDRAIGLSTGQAGMMPPWDVFHLRGRARLRQGRLREALEDLRVAMRLARAWRWSGPALDATRSGSEGILHEIHSALIEAGNRLYLETRNPALIEETFGAVEEDRASSLRQLLQENRKAARDLPPEYWKTLSRLQRAEVNALRDPGAVAQEAVRTARAELVRMESELVPDAAPLSVDVARIERTMDNSTALFSFHLGEQASWLWALDHDGLKLYSLPRRDLVEAAGQTVSQAIRENSAASGPAGAELFRTLFGTLDIRFQKKERWLLALERGMLEMPLAALRTGSGEYVTELHTVQVVPGAGHWLDSMGREDEPLAPVFLGIGDPIYNAADPRQASRQKNVPPGMLQAASAQDGSAVLLPRLAGSGAEVEACARSWKGPHVLLTGAEASRQSLVRELGRNPAVVHFATHVLQSSEHPGYGLIALSLTPGGATELLPPLEIAHWRIHAGLVVLSGCYSAAGAEAASIAKSPTGTYTSMPGPGLMGLTRAWLAAGARSVVASRWTMPDADGVFFSAFYGELRTGEVDAARALRVAQTAMIRAGGWRAQARYWGAYFVIGNP